MFILLLILSPNNFLLHLICVIDMSYKLEMIYFNTGGPSDYHYRKKNINVNISHEVNPQKISRTTSQKFNRNTLIRHFRCMLMRVLLGDAYFIN